MTFNACNGIQLASLQNIFSTSVGVAFAYPILSQIIELKNEKVVLECRRVHKILVRKNKKIDVESLGAHRVGFDIKLQKQSRTSEKLITYSMLMGLIGFALLFFSSVNQNICIDKFQAFILCSFISTPFAFGIIQICLWFDAYSNFRNKVSYFRGGNDRRSKILRTQVLFVR